MESIETVIVAVEHKIDNIYQVATMDTVAKANALQKSWDKMDIQRVMAR